MKLEIGMCLIRTLIVHLSPCMLGFSCSMLSEKNDLKCFFKKSQGKYLQEMFMFNQLHEREFLFGPILTSTYARVYAQPVYTMQK